MSELDKFIESIGTVTELEFAFYQGFLKAGFNEKQALSCAQHIMMVHLEIMMKGKNGNNIE